MSRREKINNVVSQVSKIGGTVAEDESLFDSGHVDSITLLDLIAGIEEAFSLKVPEADATPRKFDSIERIDAYLESRGA